MVRRQGIKERLRWKLGLNKAHGDCNERVGRGAYRQTKRISFGCVLGKQYWTVRTLLIDEIFQYHEFSVQTSPTNLINLQNPASCLISSAISSFSIVPLSSESTLAKILLNSSSLTLYLLAMPAWAKVFSTNLRISALSR